MTVTEPIPRPSVSDRDDGEGRRPPERAEPVAHVAPGIVDPAEGSRVALNFLGLIDPAERAPSRAPRLVRREAAPLELFLQERQVRFHLARELTLRSSRTNHVEEPQAEPAQSRHDYRSSSRSLLTNPDKRRHRSTCLSSARTPDLVIA